MATSSNNGEIAPRTGSLEDPPRLAVTKRYLQLLDDEVSNPDKIFISGSSLQTLDPNLVVLDETRHEHPRSWAFRKKARATAIVASFGFLSPFSSAIFAPSILVVMKDLQITDSTVGALQVSIFLFAFAVGPLFLAPLSEKYGRVWIIHIGNLIFVTFSVGGGFTRTATQFLVCRFIVGIGGSASISILGGFIADIWDLAARPKASGLIMIGTMLGPILGPVCGGWMSERLSWRWTIWIPAIASAILSVIGFIWLPESYAPKVLQTKLKELRKRAPDAKWYTVLDFQGTPKGLGTLMTGFVRPVVYLVLDPALFFASLFHSIAFGVIYLIIVTYADIFGTGYGFSVGLVGTAFLAAGVGTLMGTFGTIRAMEAIFKRNEASGQMKYKPESRMISCIVGGTLLVGGLFMYGFTALKVHFMVPLIAVVILTAGAANIMLAVQLYAIDGHVPPNRPRPMDSHVTISFKYPASAFAAISFLRCIFAGAFPLFGPKLFKRLGVDWGVALLSFLVLGIGLPLVVLLYIFGSRLRRIGVDRVEKFEGAVKISK
ncbi:major facilitator superfamily domain-containing protein [Pyrenochaeta sp. MPI-SDFR-AT-0127]|nr:major facilitator superfamily domain-containing protein [Pyrenochaeta sp. MPI-SDFR-AT-0127]